jgi:hypothetical protein
MQLFKVERVEAQKFSNVWHNKTGLVVPLSVEAIDFATDFANVVLNNFVAHVQAEAAKQAAKVAEMNKPKIILEGVK